MSEPVKTTTKGHLLPLDALRGIAATLVAIGHIGWTNSISSTLFVHNVYLMVDFFFVLSGFVIALNYSNRLRDSEQLGRFVWLRFWRLYPLHFFMLMVFLGIEALKWFAAKHSGLMANQAPFEVNNGWAFFTNLLLIQALGTNPTDTFNPPAWSISTEFYTYFIFAISVVLLGRRYLAGALALVVLSGAIIAWSGGNLSQSHGLLALNRCIFGFFIGVLTHRVYGRLEQSGAVGRTAWPTIVAIAFLLALLLVKSDYRLDILAPVLSAGVICSLALAGQSSISKTLSRPSMVWFGAASYSIYMTHMSIIWVIDQVIRVGLHAPSVSAGSDRAPLLSVSPVVGNLFTLIAIMLMLVVSNLTFRWIEAPIRDWSKQSLQRRMAPRTSQTRG